MSNAVSPSASAVCPICHQAYRKTYLSDHVEQVHFARRRNRSMTSYVCDICSKHLTSKRSYTEHLNTHFNARPFACDHCDYKANSKMNLRRHVQRKHDVLNRRYSCAYCRQTFVTADSYQAHLKRAHPGKPGTFKCAYCDMVTFSAPHFEFHLERHAKGEILNKDFQPVTYAEGVSPSDFLCHASVPAAPLKPEEYRRRRHDATIALEVKEKERKLVADSGSGRNNNNGSVVESTDSSSSSSEMDKEERPYSMAARRKRRLRRQMNAERANDARRKSALVYAKASTLCCIARASRLEHIPNEDGNGDGEQDDVSCSRGRRKRVVETSTLVNVNAADAEDNRRFLEFFLPAKKPIVTTANTTTSEAPHKVEDNNVLMDVDLD